MFCHNSARCGRILDEYVSKGLKTLWQNEMQNARMLGLTR